jgi:hypothetical protein
MKEIQQRDCDDAIVVPENPESFEKIYKQILRPRKQNYEPIVGKSNPNRKSGIQYLRNGFVMVAGLSCTGKSTFLKHYENHKNWDLTVWDRDKIFNMLFQSGRRPRDYYGKIQNLEKDIFPDLLDMDFHQVILEGWYRKKGGRSGRKRWLNFINDFDKIGKTIIVFDGPVENILMRTKAEDRLNMSDEELEMTIKEKHNTFDWPTYDEGWDHIYYATTFGKTGAKYLRSRVNRINRE